MAARRVASSRKKRSIARRSSWMFEQAQAEILERLPRGAAKQATPLRGGACGQTPKADDVGVSRHARSLAPSPHARVSDEAQEPHQREESLLRDRARSERAVELEARKRPRARGQTEVRLAAVHANPDERVEERERPCDVLAG